MNISLRKLAVLAVVAVLPAVNGWAVHKAMQFTEDINDLTKWHWVHSDAQFDTCMSYAKDNNIPMIMIWGSSTCGQCSGLEHAVGKDEDELRGKFNFLQWQQTAGYLFVFAEDTPDGSASKEFVRNNSGLWPYVAISWLKPDGSTVAKKFSGRSNTMPTTQGDSLQEIFKNSIELVLTGSVPSSSDNYSPSTPSSTKPTIPTYWSKSHNVTSIVMPVDGDAFDAVATVEFKLGKANAKKGTAKVSATVEFLTGGKKKFSGTVPVETPIVLNSGYGTLTLTAVDTAGISGTLACQDGTFKIETHTLGGAFAAGVLHFKLVPDLPAQYQGNPVMQEWLPRDLAFEVKGGGRWALPSGGSVKWDRTEQKFVASKPENPSGLKLSYKSKSGEFTGSYKTYVKTGDTKLKKVTTKITGIVIDATGVGVAGGKDLDPVLLTISSDPNFSL